MANHTPGPWVFEGYKVITTAESLSDNRTFGYGCQNDFVCDLDDGEYHNYAHEDEMTVNGYLIAAAPDLLAACKSALEDGELYRLSETIKRQLKAAIARAEGRDDE